MTALGNYRANVETLGGIPKIMGDSRKLHHTTVTHRMPTKLTMTKKDVRELRGAENAGVKNVARSKMQRVERPGV